MKKKRVKITAASTLDNKRATFIVSEKITASAILFFSILFTIVCRLRLLGIPLERDEGEYAYVGQQLLAGIPPFVSIYHVKFPGIYAVYSIIEAIFGQTIVGIHLGLLFANISTGIVLFFIGTRFLNPLNSALAVSCFLILTLSQTMFGFSANAEHFLILFVVIGILLALIATDPKIKINEILSRLKLPCGSILLSKNSLVFYSGLSLGIAYTIKQQAIVFIAFTLLFLCFKWITEKPVSGKNILFGGLLFCIGAGLPFGITCLIFLRLGIFEKFWWWTWFYPRVYANLISHSQAFDFFEFTFFSSPDHTGISSVFWPLLSLALLGVVGTIQNNNRSKTFFLMALFLFSLVAVSIGLSFYPHSFLLAAPCIALIAASGGESVTEYFHNRKLAGIIAVLFVLLFAIYMERSYLFYSDETSIARASYGGNPFAESVKIGSLIKLNTLPEDRIAVLGSEPQIYFYSGRRAATGYVYTYEMIADHPYAHQFQTEMIKEIQQAKPKFLVMVNIRSSWYARSVQQVDNTIFAWQAKYVSEHYTQVGIVEDDFWCWDDPQKNIHCTPKTDSWIAIYKRQQ
jgi:hypothetical protein